MAAYFELKKTEKGQWMFNLKAANHQVILTSQTYGARADALNGMESVRKNAAMDTRFERKTSTQGEPYFTLMASNGQVVGKSEMYSSSTAMENGITSVKNNAPMATLKDTTAAPDR